MISFILGASVGSFLNVVIDRLPTGRSIVRHRSYCESCDRPIGLLELIPIISYTVLHGRCRSCGARIPLRILLVELGTGTAFLLLFLSYDLTAEWAILAFYFSFFLVIAIIDLEHRLILNKLVYPASAVALLLASLYPLGMAAERDILGAFLFSLLGGAVGFGILFIPAVIREGAMGWGDVKLAGVIGLAAGFPGVLVALGLAILGGGLVAGVLLLSGLKKRGGHVPFGPFLSAGIMAALIWGKSIADWYLGFFT